MLRTGHQRPAFASVRAGPPQTTTLEGEEAVPTVRMPLFQFHMLCDPGFALGSGFSIDRFEFNDRWRLKIFSEQDVEHIRRARWALNYEGDNIKGYKALSNLILMAFRMFSVKYPPFIRYRLCAEPGESTRINQSMTYNYAFPRERDPYSFEEMEQIRTAFGHLRTMDATSNRTHNAIYYLFRAFHADKWIDSFLLMTAALESLFSKDAPGGATEAIATRVASLLGSTERCTKADVEQLYDLRSAMTHGRIVASDDPGENLAKLEHLEYVTNAAFRKLIETGKYTMFSTKAERDAYMGTLNVAL